MTTRALWEVSSLDVDQLLAEISPDAPCGEDLEYDAQFGVMERAAQGKPEQQFGDTLVPAEDPDWKSVRRTGIELLRRTKDLRAVVYLARAAAAEGDLVEFRDCLALIRGYLEQYWETVHPQLDPDDDNDPTIRVNTLAILIDFDAMLSLLMQASVVSSRAVGTFSRRDYLIAKGELPASGDAEGEPTLALIEAAFAEADPADLTTTYQAVHDSLECANAIESSLTDHAGVQFAISFSPLTTELSDIAEMLRQHLERRGIDLAAETATPDAESSTEAPDSTAAVSGGTNGEVQRVTGEIRDRQDVIRVLDMVCQYYERYEPSSPIPLLIKRAKRLASMNFVDILRNLAPDAVAQAQLLGGLDLPESSEESGGDEI